MSPQPRAACCTDPTSSSSARRSTPGRCAAGDLFVAVVAERDGHDFVGDAAAAGAGAALVSRAVDGVDVPLVVVPDTSSALLDLASWARDGLGATVVGITGSVGKTSTKDLVAAAVGAARRVAANERSFNNEQGLPVTILGAPDDTEVLVLEMGMRGLGEIARLCAVGRPDIGVVTSVAAAHTERVGGIDGRRPGQGRARRSPCPATARRYSTPTTRWSRRWRTRPQPAC